MSSVEERVKKLICEQLGVKEEEVKEEASFVEDLGADSLDTVELVMALEQEFGRTFILKGTGREHKLSQASIHQVIAPLTFPKSYDVSDPLIAQYLSLEDLADWHNAPCNARLLIESGHQVPLSRDRFPPKQPKHT